MSEGRPFRPALCLTVILLGATLAAASKAPAASPISCPKLTDAQIRAAVGGKPMPVGVGLPAGGTIAGGGGSAITCQWVLGTEPSITLKLYRGAGALGQLVKQIGAYEGAINGVANGDSATAPDCTPKVSGDCQGKKFDLHLSPLAGLGQKAYDDPGSSGDGANVEFVWKGNTYALRSSGPYGGIPGPNLQQVIAFARLIIRSGYTP